MHAGSDKNFEEIARVGNGRAFAPGPRNRKQMMMVNVDAKFRRIGKLLHYPRIAFAADLALVEIGLARIDTDDDDAVA